MRKKHHKYNPEEKVFILKRHLVEHVPLSDLCNEYQLQPMGKLGTLTGKLGTLTSFYRGKLGEN